MAVGLLFNGCSHPRVQAVTPITAKLPPDNLPAPPFQTKAQKVDAAILRWRNALLTQSVTSDTPSKLLVVESIVQKAVRQPDVQQGIKQLAKLIGSSVSQTQTMWQKLQAADLFLESGDDADAISSAGACGVAQWMPESAVRAGLKVDLPKSVLLTQKILKLEDASAASTSNTAAISGSVSPSVSTGSSTAHETNGSTNVDNIAERIADLQVQRAKVDQRFNPELSIFAQTRYLLGMVKRFPSADWLFQAYHGGESGVTRLLRLYSQRPTASAASIILGDRHHARTSFADVYLNCTPTRNVRAFDYLYSRGDDDRHYWWKILAAVKLIPTLIAQNGKLTTVPRRLLQLWYGNNADIYRFSGESMVQQGIAAGVLVPSPCTKSTCSYPAQAKGGAATIALRPIAAATLRLVMNEYHAEGGLGLPMVNITTGFPGKGSGQSGLSFQILFPKESHDLLIMTYVLERLSDRGLVGLGRILHEGPAHWIVLPCPFYGQVISRMALGGSSRQLKAVTSN